MISWVRLGDLWLQSHPATNHEFVEYLNEIEHRETSSGPELINIVNYDQPIRYTRFGWRCDKSNHLRPVVLVTHRGAIEYAKHLDADLPSPQAWAACLDAVDSVSPEADLTRCPVDVAAWHIEEFDDGPVDIIQMAKRKNVVSLLGNVAYWGEAIDQSFAYCFGIGWNKDRANLANGTVRRRWIYDTSVSTSIRLIRKACG